MVASFTGQDQDRGVGLLICGVLASASNLAAGWGENGGLVATGCHPGCSVFPGNGKENSCLKRLAADENKEIDLQKHGAETAVTQGRQKSNASLCSASR